MTRMRRLAVGEPIGPLFPGITGCIDRRHDAIRLRIPGSGEQRYCARSVPQRAANPPHMLRGRSGRRRPVVAGM